MPTNTNPYKKTLIPNIPKKLIKKTTTNKKLPNKSINNNPKIKQIQNI